MDKKLIAVVTCHARVYPKHDQGGGHHNGESRVKSVRDTWYRLWQKHSDQIDLKFFYGRWPTEATRKPEENEVFLDCGDDYYSLPDKVQAVFKWALNQGYDYVLKVDDDIFCYVDRLLANFESSDYRGYLCEGADGKYASGTAYWVSKKSMQHVAAVATDGWAEDKFVGRTLANNGIVLQHDERYHCCHCPDCQETTPEDSRITSHTVDPKKLYELMETYHGSEYSSSDHRISLDSRPGSGE